MNNPLKLENICLKNFTFLSSKNESSCCFMYGFCAPKKLRVGIFFHIISRVIIGSDTVEVFLRKSLWTLVDQKCYSYNFHIWKNASHTLFMQFHNYRKLHKSIVITEFSHMEILWLAFSYEPKKIDFFLINFSISFGCVRNRAQVKKNFGYSNID